MTRAEQTQNPNETGIKFLWAFGAIKKTEDGSVFQSIDRDTALNTGDKIKFFIRLDKQCFVYLIYCSSQNEIKVLFPHRFEVEGHEYNISQNYYIPIGKQWFELDDHVGQEKFYLLASIDRLKELEAIINQILLPGKNLERKKIVFAVESHRGGAFDNIHIFSLGKCLGIGRRHFNNI